MMAKVKKLVGAGVLGAGMLGMAVPAKAVTYYTNDTRSQSTVGTNQSGNLGPVSTVFCALTGWSTGNSTSEHAACSLNNVNGEWRLSAIVHHSGASVYCAATCYQ